MKKVSCKSFELNKATSFDFVFKCHNYYAYRNLSFRSIGRYFNYLCV